jgi:hypothetical protein
VPWFLVRGGEAPAVLSGSDPGINGGLHTMPGEQGLSKGTCHQKEVKNKSTSYL